jgi:hypothetical protein
MIASFRRPLLKSYLLLEFEMGKHLQIYTSINVFNKETAATSDWPHRTAERGERKERDGALQDRNINEVS